MSPKFSQGFSPGGVFVGVQRAFANPSGTGDTTIITAAGAGKIIQVMFLFAIATIANTIHFRSAATPISANMPFGANGGIILPFNEEGWFETAPNELLAVNMTVATATGIHVGYIVRPNL
jgi:hypothetical protein